MHKWIKFFPFMIIKLMPSLSFKSLGNTLSLLYFAFFPPLLKGITYTGILYTITSWASCYASPQELEDYGRKRPRVTKECHQPSTSSHPSASKEEQVIDLQKGHIPGIDCIRLSNITTIGYELKKVLSKIPSITEVNLNNNEIEDIGAWILAKTLSVHSQVTVLKLKGNQLGNQAVKDIAANLPHLTKLQLASNKMDADSIGYLFSLPHLKKLDLSHNFLSSKGMKEIATLLLFNISLETLKLTGTGCTFEGLQYLTPALTRNKTLKRLILAKNNFSDLQEETLKDFLTYNITLTHLDLRECQLNDEHLKSLGELLTKDNHLRIILLQDNFFTQEAIDEFYSKISSNPILEKVICDENQFDLLTLAQRGVLFAHYSLAKEFEKDGDKFKALTHFFEAGRKGHRKAAIKFLKMSLKLDEDPKIKPKNELIRTALHTSLSTKLRNLEDEMNILESKYTRGKLPQGLFAQVSTLYQQEIDQLKSYQAELDLKFARVLNDESGKKAFLEEAQLNAESIKSPELNYQKEHILEQTHIAQRDLKTTDH
ncbi:MAG: hypothetical protein IBJ00_00815 [Alphaproteobacteria bacterium]|nr:hypothetical protein [Alphaproteobacteria bacterium]